MACADSTEIPDRGTVVVPTVLWMISDPDSVPLGLVGLNATVISQVVPGASTPPQLEP